MGKQAGLEGTDLSDFLRDQRQMMREERKEELEKQKGEEQHKRQLELAELERQRLKDEHERKLQLAAQEHHLQLSIVEKQMELEKAKAEALTADAAAAAAPHNGKPSGSPKFPYFDENKDDVDVYLKRFERHARLHGWAQDQWAQHLSTLLKSDKAAEVCTWVPDDQEGNYNALKTELLKRFGLTDNGYREKFRGEIPQKGEGFSQYVTRVTTYADRWWTLAKVAKTYEALRQVILMEQLYSMLAKDLKGHLKQEKPTSMEEFIRLGEEYLDARGRLFEGWIDREKSFKSTSPGSNLVSKQKTTSQARQLNTSLNQPKRRCFKCG